MKLELINAGPFYAAINVYKDFLKFSGQGIYRSNKGKEIGGHAIEIIGYCDKNVDNRPGYRSAYWICRNSWGDNWPLEIKDKGYFALPMGENFCGVESRCGPFLPDVELETPVIDNLAYNNFIDFSKNLIGNLKT